MSRSTVVTIKVRVELAEDYTGEIPNDVEQDLQYDLVEGRIRDGLSIEVLDVHAGLIDE